jgi:hypothetical protein
MVIIETGYNLKLPSFLKIDYSAFIILGTIKNEPPTHFMTLNWYILWIRAANIFAFHKAILLLVNKSGCEESPISCTARCPLLISVLLLSKWNRKIAITSVTRTRLAFVTVVTVLVAVGSG